MCSPYTEPMYYFNSILSHFFYGINPLEMSNGIPNRIGYRMVTQIVFLSIKTQNRFCILFEQINI